MNKNILLEIGTEEIPAHAMPNILSQLKTLAETAFKDSRINVGEVKTLGTPRRMALGWRMMSLSYLLKDTLP